MIEFPTDRKRFVYLNILAGLNALSAQNALAGIVAIEGIGHIHFVRLWREGMLLMLNIERKSRIVDAAIFVIVVADRAVEHVIAENHVKGLGAGILGAF
jgi:hypothetical protein